MAHLPISDFLIARLQEYDPNFQVRKGTAFEQLFFKPMQFIIQPFRDEADVLQTAQSFRRILLTESPDSFDEESVDALAANLFVTRVSGAHASGVARVYYDSAVNREWPTGGALFTGSNSATYANTAPYAISAVQMGAQIENGQFYYDIPITATATGSGGDLGVAGIVSLAGDPNYISVTNKTAIVGGVAKETNTKFIERTKQSIAVRDLVTGKGATATLFENFPTTMTELQAVGFGDDEMMRDILFHTHVGGKVDFYVKTPKVTTTTKYFKGLLIDVTRQAPTATNVQLVGTAFESLRTSNVDRSNNLDPIVQELKTSTAATYTSPVDLSTPINLSTGSHVRITIDGIAREVNVAGVVPGATNRNEIVAKINAAFGVNVASLLGNSIKVTSTTKGLASELVLDDPISQPSALSAVFGSIVAIHRVGDGPVTYVEGSHYEIDDANGQIRRVLGATKVTSLVGASTAASNVFTDPSGSQFAFILDRDILTITAGPDAKDYRILHVTDNNSLLLDAPLTATSSSVHYTIRRTGIKDNEVVYVQYYFNPLSIDIGKLVKLDDAGKSRGIRPNRDSETITDVAFLRTTKIELVDPITLEPLGQILNGTGGFGTGGFGEGPFGIGSSPDYYLVVGSPTERFSAFEDSYLVLSNAFEGFSFAVTYEYVPEVETFHTFCRSETERVLDGDLLVKHFLPAYVSGEIKYSVDLTDSSVPTNDVLLGLVKEFINLRPAGSKLQLSHIEQFILRMTDPFDRYGTSVKPFSLSAEIHNTDGSTTVVSSADALTVPTPKPFPKDTPSPLSPRITHWLADAIVLTRV
jgi:hypothetical protein